MLDRNENIRKLENHIQKLDQDLDSKNDEVAKTLTETHLLKVSIKTCFIYLFLKTDSSITAEFGVGQRRSFEYGETIKRQRQYCKLKLFKILKINFQNLINFFCLLLIQINSQINEIERLKNDLSELRHQLQHCLAEVN